MNKIRVEERDIINLKQNNLHERLGKTGLRREQNKKNLKIKTEMSHNLLEKQLSRRRL